MRIRLRYNPTFILSAMTLYACGNTVRPVNMSNNVPAS